MKTITFYSYKGGVGRSLLLANVARYLCRFGQKVMALDFDLEAPGLHYKLLSPEARQAISTSKGLVDYIYTFAQQRHRPDSLRSFVADVPSDINTVGRIQLFHAGGMSSAEYWRRLAAINWHEFFYTGDVPGIPFFLELKAKIEHEFAPDYLLIDSRTGITEIGGVATTVLPDCVVALLLNTPENLEGARQVLRSIRRTRRARNQSSLELVPVLARFSSSSPVEESSVSQAVAGFLFEEAPEIEDTLPRSALSILHTERRIENKESVLMDAHDIDDSLLLDDYIKLITRLVPPHILAPHVDALIRSAMSIAKDDSPRAEADLLALCEHASFPAPHRALLGFYRQAGITGPRVLQSAYNYWRMCAQPDDPLLVEVVKATGSDHRKWIYVSASFIDAVWRSGLERDVDTGLELARAYLLQQQRRNAALVIEQIRDRPEMTLKQCTMALELTIQVGSPLALSLAEAHKEKLSHSRLDLSVASEFRRSWAKALTLWGTDADIASFFASMDSRTRLDVALFLDCLDLRRRSPTIDINLVQRIDPRSLAAFAIAPDPDRVKAEKLVAFADKEQVESHFLELLSDRTIVGEKPATELWSNILKAAQLVQPTDHRPLGNSAT